MLEQTLRLVARRYRLPALSAPSLKSQKLSAASILAITIEQARRALSLGASPDDTLKRTFIEALARMIREATDTQNGDPTFQTMVLRYRAAQVREYASLAAQAGQDRRQILTSVNAIAHPAKLQRIPAGQQRDALSRLQAAALSADWPKLSASTQQLLDAAENANECSFKEALIRIRQDSALTRLQRLETLANDNLVQQYLSLGNQQGPRSGSAAAIKQGSLSQQRGAAVEALAAETITALAQRLNRTQKPNTRYRAVSSMHVPASIPGSPERAKSEWDVVLLQQTKAIDNTPVWKICMLVEAKASVDAATTDLPRLLRGLDLLSQADEDTIYPFEAREGTVLLDGAALRPLSIDEPDLHNMVLYCSNAPADASPRLLNAASRMQLLSAQASLQFAAKLIEQQEVDAHSLETVWYQLLESARWRTVLNQYAVLRQVRELMVHTDDLSAAIITAEAEQP
ncbi:3-deoxy-D-arabino-heptulosonate 7-phosphate synthase [Paenalcaligenes niemegkensis]|uniref:3-deoxy-D-arabino-heptulosonate 7-phosphate synthase n=1 Tax=Paenalcaligenes niemegkensis TaxID=2895469 RepID=UPI001EE88FED|nr:3-deoxy-D-arabino-heptulosonate 7-phosphate synthase [Paenalcaligenes niemegkensis]MCQ9616485.1 3-deoxy-D-arabino-heptulosonate 7-phosphate synthase [Paenalcaligenes niemegkensis]